MNSQITDKFSRAATTDIKTITKETGIVFVYFFDGSLMDHRYDTDQPEFVFSQDDYAIRV